MEILTADIKYYKKSGLDSAAMEGVQHTKVLPYLSIVQVLEGDYEIALGRDVLRRTGEGGFFVAPADVRQTIIHHVNPHSKRMRARWLFLDVEVNKAHSLDELFVFPTIPTGAQRDALNALFDRLFETNSTWSEYALCYEIAERLTEGATASGKSARDGVDDAMLYMMEHFSEPLTITALAGIACMSEPNFYRSFKKRFDLSPISYLNCYRLSVAANKLAETDETIKATCCSVGISDPLYFSKMFKKVYGMSPKAYRTPYQKAIPNGEA